MRRLQTGNQLLLSLPSLQCCVRYTLYLSIYLFICNLCRPNLSALRPSLILNLLEMCHGEATWNPITSSQIRFLSSKIDLCPLSLTLEKLLKGRSSEKTCFASSCDEADDTHVQLVPSSTCSSLLGKRRTFVYSHIHPTGRVYEPRPKPEGIAFGGSNGNERVFSDEVFPKLRFITMLLTRLTNTVPCHAVMVFYQLKPPFWRLRYGDFGGKLSASHKRREELFNEQRRTVDLKPYPNWEDSPEKMMMDMMSNPNTVLREDQ